MKRSIIVFLATGAYSGYSPFAPGTVGTLWGVPLWFLLSRVGPVEGALVLALGAAISIALAQRARHFIAQGAVGAGGDKDPAPIICDEVIGFAFAAYLLPFTLANIILVFILFRIFDILKPYPAGLIDSRLEGGAGIVLDDVVAGIYANAVAHIILGWVPV